MSFRHLLAIALIAGSPAIAAAQFTTFIPPQNKVADSVKTVVVAEQKAHADSIVNTKLTNIKTWVDSASGTVMPVSNATTDTITASAMLTRADTVTMANGRRAPATASVLPLLALAGATLAALGLILLGSDRKLRLARARRA